MSHKRKVSLQFEERPTSAKKSWETGIKRGADASSHGRRVRWLSHGDGFSLHGLLLKQCFFHLVHRLCDDVCAADSEKGIDRARFGAFVSGPEPRG